MQSISETCGVESVPIVYMVNLESNENVFDKESVQTVSCKPGYHPLDTSIPMQLKCAGDDDWIQANMDIFKCVPGNYIKT